MKQLSDLRFDGRVAIVTGAARGVPLFAVDVIANQLFAFLGLGREYALSLASKGATLVINDLGGDRFGEGKSSAADEVVKEIISKGGKAVANYNSVEDGHLIVKTAIDHFGRIDIVVNNAGILRDKSFLKITDEDWDLVHRIHLRGSFIVSRAAWPYFRKQNYGRIIMTASPAGLYGNFGQTNYSSAKLGLLALSNTLAIEGSKYNIKCNTIVPVASSRLTEDILPQNLNEILKPKFVAPLVTWLSHESCPETGGVYEAAGGYFGKYIWLRSKGKVLDSQFAITPEMVRDSWQEITDMKSATSPPSIQDHLTQLVDALTANKDDNHVNDINEAYNSSQTKAIIKYTTDDAILYALAVGVSTQESDHLKFLYECSDQFDVLPTFGTIAGLKSVFLTSPLHQVLREHNIDTSNVTKLLHGEQYLEMFSPIPSSGTLVSETRIIDLLDKGSGALVIASVDTYDENGTLLFYNQIALFMIDSGNFGGKRKSDNPLIKPVIEAPNRKPDAIVFEQTSVNQAALYRLCGDKNPLHIDPSFAVIGGFSRPILHGLCSLGYAFRHVLREYANNDIHQFKCLKARFAGPVYPGETIQTNMWKEGNRIYFQCCIKETQQLILSGAYIDLINPFLNNHFNVDQSAHNLNVSEIKDQNLFASNAQQISSYDVYDNDLNAQKYMYCQEYEHEMNENCDKSSLPLDTPHEIKFLCAPPDDPQEGSSRIDKIFDSWLYYRIKENKELVPIIKTVYQWNIIKNGKIISIWTLDLKNGSGDVYKGPPKLGKPDCTLIIDDDYAVDVFEGRTDAMKAFMTGKLKITGNILAAQKLQQLWSEEAPQGVVSLEEPLQSNIVLPTNNSEDILDDKALLESIPISGLKCDIVFNVFRNRMHEEPDLVRRLRVIFQFNITKDGKLMTVWTADNKNKLEGDVYRHPPKNGKPDCIITVEDDDFLKLMVGKLNPQRAFMMGKLKIKGNIMLLQKLNSLWLDLQKVGKTPELPFMTEMMLTESVIPGVRSESMIVELVQRLVRLPQLCTEIPVVVVFDIIKDGKSISKWTLDFTKNKLSGIFNRGLPKSGKPNVTLTIDDDDFVRLTYNRINLQDAIASQRIKVEGDKSIPKKLSILFTTPTSRSKL